MLKRIFPIALLTGSGQIFSLFALKDISRYGLSMDLKAIGETDSLLLFMLNAIAMGLQTASMRDLALAGEWKQDFRQTQSARLTLGLLVSLGFVLAFFNHYYFLFLLAPLLALNSDYALYARSFPVMGAAVGFSRLFLPYGVIMLAARYQPDLIVAAYIASTVLIYMITNVCTALFLKTPLLARPSLKKLHLYIKSLPIGLEMLSLYFIGMGLMMIVPYFYSNTAAAIAFVGLKFYMLFKGLLRIIHQAFIREMSSLQVCLRVDQLCMLGGVAFTTFMICFPKTIIGIFFGQKYTGYPAYFILLTVAGLIYSIFSSTITRSMLEKKDIPNAIAASVSAVCTILLSAILSFIHPGVISVGISLIVGESIFAVSMIFILRHKNLVSERILFFLKNAGIAVIPISMVYFFGDHLQQLLIAAFLFGVVTAILHYRKFALGLSMA